VPVCPLDSFGTGGTKAGTLTALLLQALQSDGGEAGIGSVDSVLVEFDFVHIRKIGWIQRKVNRLGTVPRPSHIMLCQCDQLRILYHAFRRGRTVPLVEGLALLTFPHNGLHKGGRDSRNHEGADVGTAGVVGEDFNRLCFVHTGMMAQNRANFNRSCATPPTGCGG